MGTPPLRFFKNIIDIIPNKINRIIPNHHSIVRIRLYQCGTVTAYFYLDTDNGGIGNRLVTADILQSLQFIDEHLTTDISIDDIAFECALSTSRFKAKFKEQMGVTPLYYINSLKINRAKEMLKNSDLSVIDIAFALGFASSNYFSAVFKKFTGYSPVAYRKMKSNMQ